MACGATCTPGQAADDEMSDPLSWSLQAAAAVLLCCEFSEVSTTEALKMQSATLQVQKKRQVGEPPDRVEKMVEWMDLIDLVSNSKTFQQDDRGGISSRCRIHLVKEAALSLCHQFC